MIEENVIQTLKPPFLVPSLLPIASRPAGNCGKTRDFLNPWPMLGDMRPGDRGPGDEYPDDMPGDEQPSEYLPRGDCLGWVGGAPWSAVYWG